MINLLSTEIKKQIRAARTNVILLNYLFLSGLAVVFLAGACFVSYLLLVDSKTTAETIIKNKQSLITANPTNVANTSLSSMNTEFSTAKAILNRQVSYSDIIINLGGMLPEGITIDALSLSSNTIGTPLLIKAHAKTSDTIDTLKNNFQGSTQFSNYKIGEQTTNQNGLSGYPIEFSFEITISKDSK